MPVNEFLAFAVAPSANVMPQSEYLNDPIVSGGFTTGLLISAKTNKVWRQSSFVAASIAYFIEGALGTDVLDNGNVAQFAGQFIQAIQTIGGGSGGGGGIPEAPVNGTLYGRKDNLWAAAVPLVGGSMTGPLILNAAPTDPLGAATKGYVDTLTTAAGATVSAIPPASPAVGKLWWDSNTGQLFVWYSDANSSQWVVANSLTAALTTYSVQFSFLGGLLRDGQLLGIQRIDRAVQFAPGFAGSGAGATADATDETVITIERALAASPTAFQPIGTITIGAGAITPTFATVDGGPVRCAAGDVLRLVGPDQADATLANFYCMLVGLEE